MLTFPVACSKEAGGDVASTSTARSTATAKEKSTASAAGTTAAVPLAERFAGAAPQGIQRSNQRLGIPSGWKGGEFGDVQTANKDGFAALYDLPQFPPQLSQVELRLQSIGCKNGKLEAPVDGTVGAKKVPAKIHQGTCTFDGAPAAVWAVDVNIDKTDNPKVVLIVVKESARAALEKDIPAIAQGYADAF